MSTRTRRRKSRRNTQSGGKHEIKFILEEKDTSRIIDFEDISSLIPEFTYALKMRVINEYGIIKTVCTIEFTFNTVAELEVLHCFNTPLEPYKLKSYLIINKFLQILKAHSIQTVYLNPMPSMKLYNFYKTMGFACLGEEIDGFRGMEDTARLTLISEKKLWSNNMLKTLTNMETLNSNHMNKLADKDCIYMVGNVDNILSITKNKIIEWEK